MKDATSVTMRNYEEFGRILGDVNSESSVLSYEYYETGLADSGLASPMMVIIYQTVR